jgi:hypothetical protein
LPSFENSSASASPMPEPPPVIRIVLPEILIASIQFDRTLADQVAWLHLS